MLVIVLLWGLVRGLNKQLSYCMPEVLHFLRSNVTEPCVVCLQRGFISSPLLDLLFFVLLFFC